MTKSSLAFYGNIRPKTDMKYLAGLLICCLVPAAAHADTKLRGEVFCFPAKDVPKLVDELSEVDKNRRDIVDVSLEPKFLIKDGGVWPESFYLAKEDEVVELLPFSKEDGRVPGFIDAARKHADADVCVKDPTRADRPEYDEGLYFEMGLAPLFHNTSGKHSIKELKEGTKDGKKFYKKMIPGALAMFMPDTDYLAVRYDDFRKEGAEIYAVINGTERLLDPEPYKDMHVVSFENLEDWGATELLIRGGAYQLQPTVSVKTMKRFGWGQEEEDK